MNKGKSSIKAAVSSVVEISTAAHWPVSSAQSLAEVWLFPGNSSFYNQSISLLESSAWVWLLFFWEFHSHFPCLWRPKNALCPMIPFLKMTYLLVCVYRHACVCVVCVAGHLCVPHCTGGGQRTACGFLRLPGEVSKIRLGGWAILLTIYVC